MRSAALAAASVVGAASAQTNNVNVNSAINGCVNTCQPVLAVSSQCGFPVPSDPTVALNPVAWGGSGWGSSNSWGGAGANGWGAGANGWAGFGNWGGGFGGWKKRDVAGSAPATTLNSLNTGFLSGNWGGNWNNNLQCVCNTQSIDLSQVGSQCLTCVNNALNVAYGNPWLNLLATSCGFGVVDPNDYYGLGWKKAKRSPQDGTSAPTTTPDASILPVGATATADAGTSAATSTPADGASESDGSDSTTDPSTPSLSEKGFDGSSSGGSGSNNGGGGWGYPGSYGGGGPVPAAVPVGGGVSSPPSSGGSGGAPPSGGSGGSGGAPGGAGQPVFFAGAPPKNSARGVVGLAAAGSVVLFVARAMF